MIAEREITPPAGFSRPDVGELWRFRDLFYIFIWRDVKVRYKQTALGIAWAVFQPLLTMVIFSIVFQRFARIPSGGQPYPLFVFVGLLFWNYYASALSNTANALVDNASIIQKTHFPRVLLPLATAVTPGLDFGFAFVALLGLLAYYHVIPGLSTVIVIPLALILACAAVVGPGLFLAALNVTFRDVRYVLPFFIQLLLFVTPVIYPMQTVPERFRWIFYLNPMSAVVETARSVLLGSGTVDWTLILAAAGTSVLLLVLGFWYFERTERLFADTI